MNKTKNTTRIIVGNALLIALTIVFTLISNYIPIIPGVTINLSLITIALAAMLYGWKSGLLIGAVNGIIVMFSATIFFAENPTATVFICLLKSGLAGVISAMLFKLISKKNEYVAVGVSSIIIPLVNTGLYILGVYLFFSREFFYGVLPSTLNCAIELLMSIFLTPAVYLILKTFNKKNK